jgi:hypothetical protein
MVARTRLTLRCTHTVSPVGTRITTCITSCCYTWSSARWTHSTSSTIFWTPLPILYLKFLMFRYYHYNSARNSACYMPSQSILRHLIPVIRFVIRMCDGTEHEIWLLRFSFDFMVTRATHDSERKFFMWDSRDSKVELCCFLEGCNVAPWRNEVSETCCHRSDGTGVTTLKNGSTTSSETSYAFKATNFHCVTSLLLFLL